MNQAPKLVKALRYFCQQIYSSSCRPVICLQKAYRIAINPSLFVHTKIENPEIIFQASLSSSRTTYCPLPFLLLLLLLELLVLLLLEGELFLAFVEEEELLALLLLLPEGLRVLLAEGVVALLREEDWLRDVFVRDSWRAFGALLLLVLRERLDQLPEEFLLCEPALLLLRS